MTSHEGLGLRGKACIVTGASRGIGLATADGLRAAGAKVLLVARDEQALRATTRARGGEFLVADVTADDAPRRIAATCVDRFGGVDVLVNNAGTASVVDMDEIDHAEFDRQWRLNVLAPFGLMREVAPLMAEAAEGRIVNVVSSAARRPNSQNVAYTVTKAAQLALSRVFADRWAPHGVLVNAVVPGPVTTSLWTAPGGLGEQIAGSGKGSAAIAAAAAQLPLRRFAEPGEVADVITVLCSQWASAVAGAAWAVDGGAVPTIA